MDLTKLPRFQRNRRVYMLAPPIGEDEPGCLGCAFHKEGEACSAMSVECGDRVAVEDTPEGLAKYIAARMTA